MSKTSGTVGFNVIVCPAKLPRGTFPVAEIVPTLNGVLPDTSTNEATFELFIKAAGDVFPDE